MDLFQYKKIHFIGIKGVAVTGLAVIFKNRGCEVAGSDVAEEFITDKVLEQEGILVYENFSPDNLNWQPDLVVVGASWGKTNPEVQAAYDRRLDVKLEAEIRGELSQEKITIAVTGTHGKTTTTSLLSYVFALADLKPCYLIGTAMIPDLGVNGHWDEGRYFIVEGDEYAKSKSDHSPKFLDLRPDITIITNVEWEHVDIYKTPKDIENAFERLIQLTKSKAVVCSDWPFLDNMAKKYHQKIITYGSKMDADWRLSDFSQKVNYSSFSVSKDRKIFDDFELRLLGRFNALNAISALIVASHYGIDINVIKEAFKNFSGLERRMETDYKKDYIFIDDYAHHPTEVHETLHAIRNTYIKRNIICVFQPHTVSRTEVFLPQFTKAFSDVDAVVLVDIFKSARESQVGITSQEVYEELKKYHPNVSYFGGVNETARSLLKTIKPRDIIVTMGAGDVYKIKKFLMENI